MRLALTADPELPVPPEHYGGIERVVHALVERLVERGHDVTLFAHPDSVVSATLAGYPRPRSRGAWDVLRNAWHVSSSVARGRYDVVHSFGRLAYTALPSTWGQPVLMSYQRSITPSRVAWARRLSRDRIAFSGCSHHLIRPVAGRGRWFVVHNSVPEDLYAFRATVSADAPLVFLGRVEAIKGPHLAIEVARRSGRRLVLAGNVPEEPAHRDYFATRIQPLVDGDDIRYVGPVNDAEKNELLGHAAALLMPIQWDEPFGIVMAEALACGTPVIGLRRGSVPEVVEDGVSGFVCDTVDAMAAAIARLPDLERAACRQRMEACFSDGVMVDRYEAIYRALIGEASVPDEVEPFPSGS